MKITCPYCKNVRNFKRINDKFKLMQFCDNCKMSFLNGLHKKCMYCKGEAQYEMEFNRKIGKTIKSYFFVCDKDECKQKSEDEMLIALGISRERLSEIRSQVR